jgi:glycosyltransferase involved in cell wall biosynthesis
MSRVLLVGKGAPDRGGIPTFLETLRRSCLAQAHEISFLNVAHAGIPQGGRATVMNLVRTVRDAARVRSAARGQDIVHIHSALAPTVTVLRASLLALAARSRGCSVVIHAHGGNIEFWLTTWWRKRLMRLAMAPAHRVVAVWTAGERALGEVIDAARILVIDNGVPVGAPVDPRPEARTPRILYVGLLTPRKGVVDLLDASRLLTERGVDHELWLLGGTPDEGPSAEAEVRARIGGSVRMLGTRPPEEMPSAYAAVDVFCLPSWWEAMPLSILEAMASGLAVVATDVGDVARAVLDGTTGFVVPSRSPQELAKALEAVVSDPELRRNMAAAGRAHVQERFSSDVMAREVGALYEELVAARR